MFKSASTPIAVLLLSVSAVGPALVQAGQPRHTKEDAARNVAAGAVAASTNTQRVALKPRDFGTGGPVSTPSLSIRKEVNASSDRYSASPFGTSSTSSTLGTASVASVNNTSICSNSLDQVQPTAIQDGGGGYFVAWADWRNGTEDIYATRVNGAGQALWAPDGLPVIKGPGNQSKPLIVTDGQGGAIVVWQDDRNGNFDIYAQRMSSLGVVQWGTGTDGIAVCTAAGDQRIAGITSDGANGAIVTWEDDRGGAANTDIYAQRIGNTGSMLWTTNGVALCNAAGAQQAPTIAPDWLSGAVVTWQDFRGGATSDIYAQRVNASGVVQWAANGVVLCGQAGTTQELPVIVDDGAGGAVVAWSDARTPANGLDVYAQKVNASGVIQWAVDGVALAALAGDQKKVKAVPDGSGGIVAAWHDFRAGTTCDVYARRVNSAGAPQWTPNGVSVCNAPNDQFDITLTSDNGGGGAFVVWSDSRTPADGIDIYSQHLDSSGNATWTGNGVVLCDTTLDQDQPAVVADGTGGAFVCWRDSRSGTNSDIYSQRVNSTGQLPDQCSPPVALTSGTPVSAAGPSNNYSFDQSLPIPGIFAWTAIGTRGAAGSDWDMELYSFDSYGEQPYPTCFGSPLAGSYQTSVTDFVVGNFNDNHTPPDNFNVRGFRYSGAGTASVEWDGGQDNLVVTTPSDTAYTRRSTSSTDVLECWDVPLLASTTYTVEFERTNGTADTKLLLFSSVGAPNYIFFAPRSDRVLELQRTGTFTTPPKINAVDYSATGNVEYFGVVAVNDNGQSGTYKLRFLSTPPAVGVGDQAPGLSTGIKAMAPNPSKGGVRVDFVMHEAGEVSFQIYDMQGRLASTIPSKAWQPGSWNVSWNGRGQDGQLLPAGLYFVQMKMNDRVVGVDRLTLLH